jgi:4-hydroxy-tetrahydrodipicolinate reductase
VNPIRLAIAGCTGRMGRTLVRLAAGDAAFNLVAAVTIPDDPLLGQDAGRVAGVNDLNVKIGAALTAPCAALVDFTTPAACLTWAEWCAEHGVALVSGTTGLDEAQHAALRAAAQRIPIVWAPNMSVGVNLLLAAVEELAAKLDDNWDVELTETHHRRKVDAPSGTCRALLEAICRARGQTPAQAAVHGRQGQCGPRPAGQIGVHALRMGEIVGEHEVYFTADSESLILGHRAFSRDTFAAGALRAVRWLHGRPPGLYTMRDVLRG